MNAVQCDFCGKFAPNPKASTQFRPNGSLLPSGWYAADAVRGGFNNESDGSRSGGEFCSIECVGHYFLYKVPYTAVTHE